ncbi:hypothetical protein TCON_1741 [Astathelohania contejeani]|uniref:Uncharacterized protein n=1 Tax=Astathelohania contejeani TaxID=164912 RepID=A0ABQ7HY18_9MICR|nr:hypothetical protein TCON_1741 [Thelohania contejeani]
MENERAKIRFDTKIRTDILVKNNRQDLFIYDQKKNKKIIVEVGITSQDNLQIVETEKKRKYDFLANELGLLYKAKTKIILYVMTWDGVLTKYRKNYLNKLNMTFGCRHTNGIEENNWNHTTYIQKKH